MHNENATPDQTSGQNHTTPGLGNVSTDNTNDQGTPEPSEEEVRKQQLDKMTDQLVAQGDHEKVIANGVDGYTMFLEKLSASTEDQSAKQMLATAIAEVKGSQLWALRALEVIKATAKTSDAPTA